MICPVVSVFESVFDKLYNKKGLQTAVRFAENSKDSKRMGVELDKKK